MDKCIYIVDDDIGIRESLTLLLSTEGYQCYSYPTAVAFLDDYNGDESGCMLLDVHMPELNGLELQKKLDELKSNIPIIFMSGKAGIPTAVQALKAGACDFIEKPYDIDKLFLAIEDALNLKVDDQNRLEKREQMLNYFKRLSKREAEVFYYLFDGTMTKVIAAELDISERTVEVHRSKIKSKFEERHLKALYAQLAELGMGKNDFKLE